jgi:hypothetical protein
MGSWNGTCAVSNLHITAGQDVAVFMLLRNNTEKTFCYGNALYDVCPVPFYGKYNDYGAVEDCHGFGLNIVVDALKAQLYEFGQGANEYHDCEVKRDDFDIDLLFEADLEDRLGVENHRYHSNDDYNQRELEDMRLDKGLTDSQAFELDRLANKIKKVDTFRPVTHVTVHGDVFRMIMNDWYIEDYVGEGKGTEGDNKSYTHIYFKNVADSIPEFVDRLKAAHMELKRLTEEADATGASNSVHMSLFRMTSRSVFEWNDKCLAGLYMNYFGSDSTMMWDLVSVPEKVTEYCVEEDWDGLASFAREVLTATWVNNFMAHTRKLWSKQTGHGSQGQEPLGYQLLAKSVLGILKAEHDEFAEEEDEDEVSLSTADNIPAD